MIVDCDLPKDMKRLKAKIASSLSLEPTAFVTVIAASSTGMVSITAGLVRGGIAWFTERDGRKNVSVVPASESTE